MQRDRAMRRSPSAVNAGVDLAISSRAVVAADARGEPGHDGEAVAAHDGVVASAPSAGRG